MFLRFFFLPQADKISPRTEKIPKNASSHLSLVTCHLPKTKKPQAPTRFALFCKLGRGRAPAVKESPKNMRHSLSLQSSLDHNNTDNNPPHTDAPSPGASPFFRGTITLLFLLPALLCHCTITPGGLGTPITNTCLIPSDQSGSIEGTWLASPIPVAFAATTANTFDAQEISAITAAMDSWNQFFLKSSALPAIFNYGSSSTPNTSTLADTENGSQGLCSSAILTASGSFTGQVVIYKMGSWPSDYPAAAIALTSYCKRTQTPYPSFFNAVIELNYQSFFIAGQQIPDLQSILLHELGHVIGLFHSCESSTVSGRPNCNAAGLNPDYVAASMYPVFSFYQDGSGQQKRALGTNDESRANCLYAGPSPQPSSAAAAAHSTTTTPAPQPS